MNAEVARLLATAGVPGRIDWRNVVVLYNYAPVPPPVTRSDRVAWNRGFNLVVLSGGRPEFFAKCRPVDDAVLEWETLVRSCLAGSRPGGVSVAPVQSAASDRLVVQVSAFLRGPHYGRIVSGQSTGAYIGTLRSILTGMSDLASLALRDCDRVRTTTRTVNLANASSDILTTVATIGRLDPTEAAALADALTDAGDLPSLPQHGDFWWQNLIQADGQLWAIDFDSYGTVRVPMFDDMTLVLTTLGLRAGGAIGGLSRLISNGSEARACRKLLADRATAEGLAISQLNGVLVYYLVYMAATVYRRGGAIFGAPHLEALRHAAQRLATGQRLLPSE